VATSSWFAVMSETIPLNKSGQWIHSFDINRAHLRTGHAKAPASNHAKTQPVSRYRFEYRPGTYDALTKPVVQSSGVPESEEECLEDRLPWCLHLTLRVQWGMGKR
jgi:hypothetical protein